MGSNSDGFYVGSAALVPSGRLLCVKHHRDIAFKEIKCEIKKKKNVGRVKKKKKKILNLSSPQCPFKFILIYGVEVKRKK